MNPRTGRPRLPDDQKKTVVITTRATTQERDALARVAAEDGLTTGPWLVELGMREYRKRLRRRRRQESQSGETSSQPNE